MSSTSSYVSLTDAQEHVSDDSPPSKRFKANVALVSEDIEAQPSEHQINSYSSPKRYFKERNPTLVITVDLMQHSGENKGPRATIIFN